MTAALDKTPPATAVALDAHWQEKLAKLRAKKPVRQTVSIVLDRDAEHAVAQAEMRQLQTRAAADRDPKDTKAAKAAADAEAALGDAKAALGEATVELTFQALPRTDYERIQLAHPPTDEDKENGQAYHVETFAPALMSACSVDGMSYEDAEQLMNDWNLAEASTVFQACRIVNETARITLGAT